MAHLLIFGVPIDIFDLGQGLEEEKLYEFSIFKNKLKYLTSTWDTGRINERLVGLTRCGFFLGFG